MNDYKQQSYNEPDQGNDQGPDVRPIYEQIWFIVVIFILFWPAGIILAIWRFVRDQQISAANPENLPPLSEQSAPGEMSDAQIKAKKAKTNSKRSCKVMKIWGGVLIALGACFLMTLTETYSTRDLIGTLATGIGFLLAGIILFVIAKKTVEKWDRYESYINNRGNTSIPFLASKMGKSEKEVRVDVQNMINKGFFDKPKQGITAYIDGEYDLIVMTKYGEAMQPLRKAKPADDVPANSYIAKIRKEIDRTTDEELLATLKSMEKSISRIEAKIEEEPSLKNMTNIKKLKESYLPQTLELMRKFNDGEGSDETRWEIKAMLATCAKAFKNIESKVYEREEIDTKVEMEVLRKTFEREGLLGSDFDIE